MEAEAPRPDPPRLSRAGRVIVALLLLGVGIAATGAVLLSHQLRARAGPPSGTLVADSIGATLRIARDEFGVPHVRAESWADAYFGLVFVHAQDRMWQLEVLRRSARGRAALRETLN